MLSAKKELFTRPSGGYQISRSVRLRSSASAYLNRTFGTPTSGTTWTWSGWVKLGTIPSTGTLFEAGTGATNTFMRCTFGQVSAELNWRQVTAAGGLAAEKGTSMLFRDPSAWYHIVCVWDTSNATAADRQRVYVNGLQVTAFGASTNPSLNLVSYFNTASYVHYLGALNVGGLSNYLDGYLTEINFIDGQALTPSSFGETNAVTGVWQPKRYAGTYGTNGFYLNFSDNSGVTATTIGKDYSGNGNNWTPSAGISITAGATYDSMIDVPTLYADGSTGRGNYCTWNPLVPGWSGSLSGYPEANLSIYGSGTQRAIGTQQFPTTGKWYYEINGISYGASGGAYIGVTTNPTDPIVTTICMYVNDGTKYVNGSSSAYGATYGAASSNTDVIGVAVDNDAGTVTFYKNNVSQGAITHGLGNVLYPSMYKTGVNTGYAPATFGQRPFTYTPPTGFLALNTQNLPTPTISNGATVMAATLYTGNSPTGQNITNTVNSVSFQPDFVWIKNRSTVGGYNHQLFDSVRGATKVLRSSVTGSEYTDANGMTAFNSNGFSVGSNADEVNLSGAAFVGWQWNAGGTTVTNTSGTISSQVRANPTAGFSVVTYTGNGTSGATVGHGLGIAPRMVIVKSRSGTTSWFVAHASLATNANLLLNTTDRAYTNSEVGGFGSGVIGGLTSTTFQCVAGTISPSNVTNINTSSATYVAYCFAEVAGYSAFGKYTGNGSTDGPFVYLGFRPRWVLFKRTDSTESWMLLDSSRDTYNVAGNFLLPNTSDAETASPPRADFLSNGFKVRAGAASGPNVSGGTYIYAAFAENPFKNSLAR